MSWVLITLLAALFQSIRSASQKQLVASLNPWTVSYARFIFGAPMLLIGMFIFQESINHVELAPKFWLYIVSMACAQLIASVAAVMLLGRRNFAVGSSLVKCEVIFTGLIAVVVIAEPISALGWFAIIINLLGILLASFYKFDLTVKKVVENLDSVSAYLGLLAGLFFAIASVSSRKASFEVIGLEDGFEKGAVVLMCALSVQFTISLIFMLLKQRTCLAEMKANVKACSFIGLASMLGSLCWAAAFSMHNVAYVKVLGQVEFIFMTLITLYYFKEKILTHEYVSIGLLLISILLVLV